MPTPLQIRPFESADWPGIWVLLEPVFRAGETFPHDPAITEDEARTLWVDQSQAVLVALDASDNVVGSYYLRPNSLSLGAHVANAGYVVAEHCRRKGIGSRLPAAVGLVLGVVAQLLGFRGVDARQSKPLAVNVDGIAVDD